MLKNTASWTNRALWLHSKNKISANNCDANSLFKANTISSSFKPSHSMTFRLKQQFSFFRNDVAIDYKKNYYEILQVKQSATLMDIKKSFYKLAKESHPDTSKGNQDLFKKINEAYNVLSHQERRKLYDANRLRTVQNPNDFKAQTQESRTSSTYEQRESSGYEDYKHSQEYEQRKQQAYYHFNRGQWHQFRSGYKYHVSPQNQYYTNITNNLSSQKLYRNMKKKHQQKSQQQVAFLNDMERYFEYVQKINQKKRKDIEDYHRKMQEMEKQLYEERKDKFKKTIIGKGYYMIKDAFQTLLSKQSKKQQEK